MGPMPPSASLLDRIIYKGAVQDLNLHVLVLVESVSRCVTLWVFRLFACSCKWKRLWRRGMRIDGIGGIGGGGGGGYQPSAPDA